MANRISSSQRDRIYPYVVKVHGDYCIACFIESGVNKGPPPREPGVIKGRPPRLLELDHANGDVTDWSPDNIFCVCKKHNLLFRDMKPQAHLKLLKSYSIRNERERERANLSTRKTVVKEDADYKAGPPEMKANSTYEPRWLTFVHEQLDADGSIKKEEAISGGAHFSGCAIQTSRNYLIKYTSPWSCFKETVDSSGNKIIVFRQAKR